MTSHLIQPVTDTHWSQSQCHVLWQQLLIRWRCSSRCVCVCVVRATQNSGMSNLGPCEFLLIRLPLLNRFFPRAFNSSSWWATGACGCPGLTQRFHCFNVRGQVRNVLVEVRSHPRHWRLNQGQMDVVVEMLGLPPQGLLHLTLAWTLWICSLKRVLCSLSVGLLGWT